MRIPRLTTFLIILVSGLFAITATARIQYGPCQDVQPLNLLRARELQEPITTTDDVPKPTTATTRSTTTDNEYTKTSTTEMTSTTSTTSPTTTSTLNETSTSSNEKTDKLPLEPSLTPAMGVGGFILIALGAVLAGIGSRHLRIQVFLTTGFLASLGVTVLIIYVMSPPATNAVQGAYLVAVFFTGLTIGAFAIVFKELAEGLGCLLGGFCFSMWLMTLKPGDLLPETGSKIGFIAALTVVGYAVSFSRYTRKYGLIVCTAFSGGTALVLGVDCFSRAGLKEFWLYIWDLNDKTFPGDTSTYPINRNIRVELAVTVVVTLLGVISQLRLWKMIRQHFRGNTKDHGDEKRRHDDAELEAARQFEENIIRERAEWEARYDVRTPHAQNRAIAKSISIQELPVDEHEIHEKEAGSESTANCNGADSPEQSHHCEGRRTREANRETFYFTSETDSQTSGETPHGSESGIEPTADQTQLPLFNVVAAASMDHGHDHDDNQSTASAVIGSEMDTMRSIARSRTPNGQQWPPAPSNMPVCDKTSGASVSSDKHGDRTSMTERDITEQAPRMEDPKPEEDAQGKHNPTGTRTQSHPETGEPNPKRTSLNEDTIKDLPQRASRIVQSYRTNEWAKHLDDAEIPEPPPIRPIEEDQPKIPVEASGKQAVAPVNVKELLQTPLNAQPPPAVERKQQQHSPPRGSHELQSKQTKTSALPQPPPPAAKEHDGRSLRPKWKGPPPLLAVREDLVRYKPSSTCVSVDPWLRFRNNPRNLNTIHPPRTRSIPGEEGGGGGGRVEEADDLPLSQRRAMLQAQSPPDTGTHTAISRSITSPDTRENTNNEHAIMAAWRNSVHEDLQGRRNPLGPIASNSANGGPGSLPGPAERASSSRSSFPTTSPFAFGQSPRDRTSAMTLHIENKIATSMQKGDMHDLHREAIKQLQASATRRA